MPIFAIPHWMESFGSTDFPAVLKVRTMAVPVKPGRRCLYLFFLLFGGTLLFPVQILPAQALFHLSGQVLDARSREPVVNAAVWLPALKKGCTADVEGRYSLALPPGEHEVQVSCLGFTSVQVELKVTQDMSRNFFLQADAVLLKDVEIRGSKATREAKNSIGMVSFTPEMIQRIPALLGEPDIIKAVQLLPGVLMSTETSSGFSVRGGGLDQNAIILDHATLYNPTHTCGFFSVFNNDAVGGARIYKGDIPISYGGRLASVIDVDMKEGDFRNYHVDAGIGLLVAKATVNGPIWKDRTSFLASARATYFDLFLPLAGMDGTELGFYDVNAKIVHKSVSGKDKLSLSGYLGQDRFGMESMNVGMNYGNKMLGLTWNHLFSNRFVMNANVHVADYLSYAQQNADGYDFIWKTRITDYVGKVDWTFSPENHELRFGFDLRYHVYQPGDLKVNLHQDIGFLDSNYSYRYNQDHYHALESGIYIGNNQSIGERLLVKYGLRFSTFSNQGPDSVSYFNEDYERTGREYEDGRNFYHTYWGLEPRVGISYSFDYDIDLKFNYTRTLQYSQLATNSTSGNPLDIWFPANPFVKPQTSDMLALGISKAFRKGEWELSLEAYYKFLHNVIDFKDHSNVILNTDLYGELRMGRGWAYGIEFYLKRNTGMVNGSLSYTYSRSMRVIDQVNDGKPYPSPQDRPHAVNLLLDIEPHPRHSISLNWMFYSGEPTTYPIGKAVIDGTFVPIYGDRNSGRMENYHRLDVSYTFKSKPDNGKPYRWSLSAGLYNAYGRKNPWSVTFYQDPDNPTRSYAVKIYLFSVVPFVTFNFNF